MVEPVAGGLLAIPNEKIVKHAPVNAKSYFELTLKFVLANSSVHVAFSDMSTLQQVKENVAIVSNPRKFSLAEVKKLGEIFESQKKLLELYSTGCQYCMSCPNKVNIPAIFRLLNLTKVYGFTERAKRGCQALKPEEKASMCTECGICESRCPQKIPIRKKLKEVQVYLKTNTALSYIQKI